jgi:hypothetical protein
VIGLSARLPFYLISLSDGRFDLTNLIRAESGLTPLVITYKRININLYFISLTRVKYGLFYLLFSTNVVYFALIPGLDFVDVDK